MKFNHISILGPGLLGASIAMNLKRQNLQEGNAFSISVWARNPKSLLRANELGFCDFSSVELKPVVKNADLVIICTPVESIPKYFKAIKKFLKSTAIVTDVGSTKDNIVNCIFSDPQASQYIGSHPMAGSENSGMDFARDNLFENRPCMITPTTKNDSKSVDKLVSFWESLGMCVSKISSREHDKIVAQISHVPHAVAVALCRQFILDPEILSMCGTGFKDSSRIAGGNPYLWLQIFRENRVAVFNALQTYQQELDQFQELLQQESWDRLEAYLKEGKEIRDSL